MTTSDQHLKEVFHKPPMVAFRQPKNSSLRSRLVKTKLPTRNQRTLPGSKNVKNQDVAPVNTYQKESKYAVLITRKLL